MKKILALFSLIFIVSCGSGAFDPEDCNATQPKQPKIDGDSYSISSKGYPLKNGKEYTRPNNPDSYTKEIYKIVLAQGGSLGQALDTCRRAIFSAKDDASRYGRDAEMEARKMLPMNQEKCFDLNMFYLNNTIALNKLRNDKTYEEKIVIKADGYYEKCYFDGKVEERYSILDGVKNGLYERYYSISGATQLKESANYLNGELEGEIVSFFKNGVLEEKANYRNGKKEGLFISNYYNGQLRSQQSYVNGQKNGSFEYYYEDGALYKKADFKDGKYVGIYESYYPDRQLKQKSSASYLNKGDIKDGKSEKYFENGQLEEQESYKKGIKDGYFESNAKNGNSILKTSYKNGKKDGLFESYYDNGNLEKKALYVNDVADGIYELYYENGLLWVKGNYKEGKPEGIHEKYNENGQLLEEVSHKDGIKFRSTGYLYDSAYPYEGSYLKEKYSYKDGRKDGLWISNKHECGFVHPETQESYKDGKKDGQFLEYIFVSIRNDYGNYDRCPPKEARLVEKINYKDGLLSGTLEKWSRTSGERIIKESYLNGKKDGPFQVNWDNRGNGPKTKGSYKQNLKDGVFEYYWNDGILSERVIYKMGKKNGLEEKYNKYGFPISKITYKDNILDGLSIKYHSVKKTSYNNNPEVVVDTKTNYKNGKAVPPIERYDIYGNLIEISTEENGEIIQELYEYRSDKLVSKNICIKNICEYEKYNTYNSNLSSKGKLIKNIDNTIDQLEESYNNDGDLRRKITYDKEGRIYKEEAYQRFQGGNVYKKIISIPSKNIVITESYCKSGEIKSIIEDLTIPGSRTERSIVLEQKCPII